MTQNSALGTQHSSIIVGTHALISDKHVFDKVGLVIIDEQHRFGVAQRAILKYKSTSKASASPHLLTMTATPIPRTIALTLFGDLDISVLTDMPIGRLPVKTYLAPQAKRPGAYEWIRKQISATGCQVFVVCPRISDEDDEVADTEETKLSIKAVESESEMLKTKIFPDLRVAMLHGKLKPAEKNSIMEKFKHKEFDILVTTTVVEVGIDIPNATIMVIEGAERYGLAQLHQLRGRVGRSSAQSYCVLFTTDGMNESERLSFFAKTSKGMELAEYDFRHRGPGNIYGTAQHGIGELQIANLFDFALVSATQKAANSVAETYTPEKYPAVAKRLEQYSSQAIARD
jgi:ATP-dependent DNA helicase RecG